MESSLVELILITFVRDRYGCVKIITCCCSFYSTLLVRASANDGNVLYKKNREEQKDRKREKEIGEYRKIGQIFLQLIDC